MIRSLPAVTALALLAACETRTPAADSAALAPVDTATPVVVNATADSVRRADSMRAADSVARAGTPATPRPGSSPATKSPTRSTTTKTDSLHPNIGRDSVIRRPRPFPSTDTTKRP